MPVCNFYIIRYLGGLHCIEKEARGNMEGGKEDKENCPMVSLRSLMCFEFRLITFISLN